MPVSQLESHVELLIVQETDSETDSFSDFSDFSVFSAFSTLLTFLLHPVSPQSLRLIP